MTDAQKVSEYIAKQSNWAEELQTLRRIFQQTQLKEEVKWGSPTYTLDGKIVVGYAGFKHHCAIWFHQGVFLKDPYNVLHNAQAGKTKAMRQWRFEKGDPIPEGKVLEYLNESIDNTKAGKELKPKRDKKLVIPPILQDALKKDPKLQEAFSDLSPGKQREYANHIGSAKREATQVNRLEKAQPLILKGVGLYDKYKDC